MKRILASNRAEVGSTLEGRRLKVAEFGDAVVESTMSAFTAKFYGITRGRQDAIAVQVTGGRSQKKIVALDT
jgi:hypothetical protein